MKREKRRESPFRGKVAADAHEQKQSKSKYGILELPKDIKLFKVDEAGRVDLDIIPYIITSNHHLDRNERTKKALVGDEWYKRPFRVHRNVGVNNATITCPSSIGKSCPICEYRAKKVKGQADWEEIKPLNYSLRNLYMVIPLNAKKYVEEPHIWDISHYLFQDLLIDELEDPEKQEFEIFPDLDEGYTLRIRFEEKPLGKQSYFQAQRIDFKKRAEPYDRSILEDMPDLDNALKIRTHKEIEAMFFEFENEDDGDKEEATTHHHRKRKQIEPEEKKDEDEERCPHGHKFGIDTDVYDECVKCKEWDDCMLEKEAKEATE